MFRKREVILWLMLSLALVVEGCKKHPPPPPPPPPPARVTPEPPPSVTPPPPVVQQFTAEPSAIQRGDSSTLRWQVSGQVTGVSINNGIGNVQSTGGRLVTPTGSTTYTLTANGPGGTVTGVTTVTVTSAPPPPPPPPTDSGRGGTLETRVNDLQDAYFDYDKSDIRGDARDALNRDAAALKSILADFPNASIVLEGHCDERGSAEYNLGLGDRRGSAAKDFLVQLGVPADRIRTISYGKERPACTESTEDCWQKNRRAHFSSGQ
jgi:peptidoglycan-associated lipoprotein